MDRSLIGMDAIIGAAWEKAPSLDDVRAGKAYLSRGQKGPAVTYIQKALGLVPDSEFGSDTEAAVKQFQAHIGIDSSRASLGYIGANTLVELEKSATADRGNIIPTVQPDAPPERQGRSAPRRPRVEVLVPGAGLVSVPGSGPLVPLPLTAAAGGPSWFTQPIYEGSTVKRWHGMVAGGGLLLALAGIIGLTRGRGRSEMPRSYSRQFAAGGGGGNPPWILEG